MDNTKISVLSFKGINPKIHTSVFLCDGVRIIGDVDIGEDSSVWFNSVIRGDVHYVKIGNCTNVQDMSMLHVTNDRFPLIVGSFVTVAHSVTLHGCTVEDNCIIGIGARVLDGAVVRSNSIVGAGSVVREGFVVPSGVLVAGVPAKIIRELKEEDYGKIKLFANNYLGYVKEYRNG